MNKKTTYTKQYRRTTTTVSMVNYHIVFCPRYRKKIFSIPGLEERFKELTAAECARHGFEILALECNVDHAHMFVNVPPTYSPADVCKFIKGASSSKLRREFSELSRIPSLWTRSYFASTAGNVSSGTIMQYIREQKNRS